MKMAICGIVFGVMACIGFFALKPWAETTFQKDPGKVTIPRDEEEETDDKEEEPKTEVVVADLNMESYRQLNQSLYQVAKEVGKSIVEVRGIHGNEGWIKESFDTVNSVSGVILADNGLEILILANNSILDGAESTSVTFEDGSTYPSKLKKQDKNLGIAVFSVVRANMKSNTLEQMKVANLGNSNLVHRGDMLIALGKPFGYSDGLGYGVASSIKKEITLADGDYSLLLSDIAGSSKGSGVLANVRGEVVGLIMPKITSGANVYTTNALAISDLKKTIEMLSNGLSVPYIGILGTEVNEEIEKEQGIPRGVYVKNVETDSPAMQAGIQNGDIITNVAKSKITTWDAYQKAILEYKAGDQITLSGQRRGNDGYVEITFNVTIGSRE